MQLSNVTRDVHATGWDGKKVSFDTFWNQFLSDKMAETGKSHHQIIAEYYLRPIAEAIRILNGNTGNVEDYFGYILSGLYYDKEGIEVINPFITDNYLSYADVVRAYNTSKNVVPIVNTFNFTCL